MCHSGAFLPSEVKQRHGDLSQELRCLSLLVGVWRAASVLIEYTKNAETQNGLQGEHCHRHGKTDPERRGGGTTSRVSEKERESEEERLTYSSSHLAW